MSDQDMLSAINFEEHLKEMGDNQLELLKFVARQQFAMSRLCPTHSKRIEQLEHRTRREIGATGGIGAAIALAITYALDYLFRH